ncbi:hypothetical protein [Agrobacterium sp. T29]|uniref:hypothetical protein n=1 Tax=Agrobacterium sp. T29 TaxID=2580515 RepID=UPI00115CC1BF|nr:hypothetical protein [Agrobacterium sp. T29]
MQLKSSIFTNPAQRAGLEKYYDAQKSELLASLKAREADPSFQATFTSELTMPDGKTLSGKGWRITSEMAEKAMVSFDKWLEIMADTYESQETLFDMAQQRMTMLEAENPDTSSHVRTAFSAGGELLAYINEDGSLVTSNIGPRHGETMTHTALELKLQAILQQADAMRLSGENRIDYLNREVRNALSYERGDVAMTSYDSGASPTKREFGKAWHTTFDVDQVYADALADARASYDSTKVLHDQWQENLRKMQSFLLGLQETA